MIHHKFIKVSRIILFVFIFSKVLWHKGISSISLNTVELIQFCLKNFLINFVEHISSFQLNAFC